MLINPDFVEIQNQCVADKDMLLANIKENMSLIKHWVRPCKAGNPVANILLGGKTDFCVYDGAHIFGTKHSLSVVPNPGFLVNVHPLPLEGKSEHTGEDLSEMIKPEKGTVYLTASVAHPSYTKFLLDNGCKVLGFHMANNAFRGEEEYYNEPLLAELGIDREDILPNRSCSGMVAFDVAVRLGYRDFEIYGADFGVIVDDDVPEGYKLRCMVDGKEVATSPELLAARQDLINILRYYDGQDGISIKVEGLLGKKTWEKYAVSAYPTVETFLYECFGETGQ